MKNRLTERISEEGMGNTDGLNAKTLPSFLIENKGVVKNSVLSPVCSCNSLSFLGIDPLDIVT